jgi:mRNA interferase MazF
MPDRGDIVLIPVPFTDLTAQKRRPVIIISNRTFHDASADIPVVAMTSQPRQTPFGFQITNSDLVEGTLNRPGFVRPDKIYTLARSIIVKKFGRVSPSIIERIRKLIETFTSTP